MVRLKVTGHLQKTLEALSKSQCNPGADLPFELAELLQKHLDLKQAWVEHTLLARISRWNKKRQSPNSSYNLAALVRGSEVYFDPPLVKERSPELEAILAPIRLANEQAEYASMMSRSEQHTRNLDPFDGSSRWDFSTASHPQMSVTQEWESVRRELSAVANVIASMATVATAVYWAAGNTPLVQKVLMSLFGAFAIAAVEAFLYIRFFNSKNAKPPKAFSSLTQQTSQRRRVLPAATLALHDKKR